MTTTSPPSPRALLAEVRRAVRALREDAPGTAAREWEHQTRQAAITDLDTALRELTVYRGQVLVAHQEEGRWGTVRDRDFADWRARATGTGRGAALGELDLAQGLGQMPQVAGALDRGDLTIEHARTLTRLRQQASTEVQKALDDGALDTLVTQATRDKLTAPELGKKARTWAARIDAQAAQADFDAVRRRRSLTMRGQAGGIKGEFFLDPVAGAQLRTALDAITGRPAADEDRTKEQRTADALSTLASRTLQVGADLTGAQVRPHISLLVNQDTWTGILARRRAIAKTQTEAPEGAATGGPTPPLPDVPPAELEDGTVVPVGELEQIMCDSEVTRMVMNAFGIPLDVGRTQRTFTKELRRAILTRDRHCQWPDCTLRASWSEVHHITWYSRGGRTALSEGITGCSYHHHLIHKLDIKITALPDGFDFHYPDGRHLGTTRRSDHPGTRLPETRATEAVRAQEAAARTPATAATTSEAATAGTAPTAGATPTAGTASTVTPTAGATPTVGPASTPELEPPLELELGLEPERELRPEPAIPPEPPTTEPDRPARTYPSTYATAPPAQWNSDPPF